MKRINVFSHLMGVVVLATFIPLKIYPAIYLLCGVAVASFGLVRRVFIYSVFLALFVAYSVFIYFMHWGIDGANTAVIKLVISSTLLLIISQSIIIPAIEANGRVVLVIVERYLRICLVLCLIQVLILQLQTGGLRISADNSYEAGLMFSEHFVFWGVDDKNIFGSKLALFGFLHSLIRFKIKGRIEYSYAAIYIIASLMTLSRTAFLFSVASFSILFLYSIGNKILYFYLVPFLAVAAGFIYPYIFAVARINSITNGSMNDGMGIRILYWRVFFNNIENISFWGGGISSAKDFILSHGVLMSGQNLHNLFFNTYLEVGGIGLLLYVSFFLSFVYFLFRHGKYPYQVLISAFLIFLMINTLYTSYDNDVWVYFIFMYVISMASDVNRVKTPMTSVGQVNKLVGSEKPSKAC